jgi:hypothetical protein
LNFCSGVRIDRTMLSSIAALRTASPHHGRHIKQGKRDTKREL